MSKIIYYPYISLPQKQWTFRQLLYFDEIATIVPIEYYENPDMYPPFMRELLREGLVTPQNFSHDYDLQNALSVGFLNYLKGIDCRKRSLDFPSQTGGITRVWPVIKTVRIYNSKLRDVRGHQYEGPEYNRELLRAQIYRSKLGPDILRELEKLELAKFNNDGIIDIERRTALELMQFLASLIGDKIDAYPTTDTFPFFAHKKKENQVVRVKNDKRETILKRIMPMPEDIDFARLMRFKERYRDLMTIFRNKIEQIVLNEHLNIGTELFDETIKDLELQSIEISRRMGEYNCGKILRYSVYGMIPCIADTISGEIDNKTLVVGGATLITAIGTAIKDLHPRQIDNTSGMKYLALVNKSFPVNYTEDKRK